MTNQPNNNKTIILFCILCCCVYCCCCSSFSSCVWMGYVPGTTAAYNRASGTWDIMWDHGTNIQSSNTSGIAASDNDTICASIDANFNHVPDGYDVSTTVFAITGSQLFHTDTDGKKSCLKSQDSHIIDQYGTDFCSDYSSVKCLN